jgi:hypothetical protein
MQVATEPQSYIKVTQMYDAESPRDFSDSFTNMVCFHRRYSIGDSHKFNSDDFEGWSAFENYLIKSKDAKVILPIYMYDHSGITISTTPFSCNWDSGQIGYIYASGADIRSWFGVKRITKDLLEKVERIILNEIKEYDNYLTNEVFSVRVYDEDEEETGECWVFYGQEQLDNYLDNHKDTNIVYE